MVMTEMQNVIDTEMDSVIDRLKRKEDILLSSLGSVFGPSEKIREIRKSLNLSREELAAEAGLSTHELDLIEETDIEIYNKILRVFRNLMYFEDDRSYEEERSFRSLENSVAYLRTVKFRKSLESEKSLKGLKMTGDFIRGLREAAGVSREGLAAYAAVGPYVTRGYPFPRRLIIKVEDVERIENGEPYDSRGDRGLLASKAYYSQVVDGRLVVLNF